MSTQEAPSTGLFVAVSLQIIAWSSSSSLLAISEWTPGRVPWRKPLHWPRPLPLGSCHRCKVTQCEFKANILVEPERDVEGPPAALVLAERSRREAATRDVAPSALSRQEMPATPFWHSHNDSRRIRDSILATAAGIKTVRTSSLFKDPVQGLQIGVKENFCGAQPVCRYYSNSANEPQRDQSVLRAGLQGKPEPPFLGTHKPDSKTHSDRVALWRGRVRREDPTTRPGPFSPEKSSVAALG